MKTIALRFSDSYAPEEGMLYHHKNLIEKYGYVWYGKFGSKVSKEIIEEQLKTEDPRFLLIKSGTPERYWVHFEQFLQDDTPEMKYIPEYYRNDTDKVGSWFKVKRFEKAEGNVMSKCIVLSSGEILSNASRCMNPYFKIEYRGENNGENNSK